MCMHPMPCNFHTNLQAAGSTIVTCKCVHKYTHVYVHTYMHPMSLACCLAWRLECALAADLSPRARVRGCTLINHSHKDLIINCSVQSAWTQSSHNRHGHCHSHSRHGPSDTVQSHGHTGHGVFILATSSEHSRHGHSPVTRSHGSRGIYFSNVF
jgi:hypothetical protein